MDWLLKVLGVSQKNRSLAKKLSRVVQSLPKTAPEETEAKHKAQHKKGLVLDIHDLPFDEYEIVGESFYQTALEKHSGPKTIEGAEKIVEVMLVCERGNKHDKNAVRLEIGSDTVGYLAREDAQRFREMLDDEDARGAKVRARAKIIGGWKNDTSEGHYGLVLLLDEED